MKSVAICGVLSVKLCFEAVNAVPRLLCPIAHGGKAAARHGWLRLVVRNDLNCYEAHEHEMAAGFLCLALAVMRCSAFPSIR